jgi:PAS domain S-box-containing protein
MESPQRKNPKRSAKDSPPGARPQAQAGGEDLEALFRLSLDMLCIAGFDGRFKRVNPAWEKTLGWTAAELISRPYIDFVHADDRAATAAEAEKIAAGAVTITFENRYRCKDGSWRWLLWNASPSLEHQLIFAAARDITASKASEQKLREGEERHRLIIERASDAFVAMDAEGVITEWNVRAEEVFGWTRKEAIGSYLAVLLIPPRYRASHWRGLEHYVATGEGPIMSKRVEMPALHRTGHEIPVELSITALRWGEHNYTFYAFLRDIGERKALERMKERFISMVSHELRTPLSSLRGALSLLESGKMGTLDTQGQRLLSIAHQDTERLVRLTNDILDIERMEAGRFTLVLQLCDGASLLARTVDAMRPLATEAGVQLEVAAEPLTVRCDPDRVQQALTNLIGNAIKFSASGTTVRVQVLQRGTEILFEVRDQGRGFSNEQRDALFEPFRQLEPSDAWEKGGTGLGLFIARNIVGQHGGRIWADSVPGRGSTFCFTLPAAPIPNRSPDRGAAVHVAPPGPDDPHADTSDDTHSDR